MDKQQVYTASIKRMCPDIDIRSVRVQSQDSENNDILVINEELAFRFPRRPENILDSLREMELLPKIRKYLPLSIPNPLYFNKDGSEPATIFMGYLLLPGTPLSFDELNSITDDLVLNDLARQLADFLIALHKLTPASIGMPIPELVVPEWMKSFFSEVKEHLFSFMRADVREELGRHFDNYFNTPDLHEYQPAFIHGDFGGSNILFDRYQVSGIMDFNGARMSDPALDIASVSTYGESFFARIRLFYPVTDSMLNRVKFYRSIFALEEALYGKKNNDREAFSRGMEQYL